MVIIAVLINDPSHPAHLCTTQGEKQDRTEDTACSSVLCWERVLVVRCNKYKIPNQQQSSATFLERFGKIYQVNSRLGLIAYKPTMSISRYVQQ